VCGRMEHQIIVRRLLDDGADLRFVTMDTIRHRVAVPVETPVVEEIDEDRTVVVPRAGVDVEVGHVAVEPAPGDDVADPLILRVEGQASDGIAVAVSAIADLIAGQLNGELCVAVLVRCGDVSRRRGRPGEDQHRRGGGHQGSDSSHYPGALAELHC